MPLTKFIAYTTAGCLIWNTILVSLGFYVGASWREVTGVVHYLIIAVVAVALIAGLVGFLWWKKKTSKQIETPV